MESPQVSSSYVKNTTTVRCSQHLVTMFRIHPSPRVGQSQSHTFFGKVPLFWGVAWWGMIIASSYSLFTRHLSPFWHWGYYTGPSRVEYTSNAGSCAYILSIWFVTTFDVRCAEFGQLSTNCGSIWVKFAGSLVAINCPNSQPTHHWCTQYHPMACW